MTQTQSILTYLKRQPITAAQAVYELNCHRLAARINDLRNDGYQIHTEIINANGKRFARYRLDEKSYKRVSNG